MEDERKESLPQDDLLPHWRAGSSREAMSSSLYWAGLEHSAAMRPVGESPNKSYALKAPPTPLTRETTSAGARESHGSHCQVCLKRQQGTPRPTQSMSNTEGPLDFDASDAMTTALIGRRKSAITNARQHLISSESRLGPTHETKDHPRNWLSKRH